MILLANIHTLSHKSNTHFVRIYGRGLEIREKKEETTQQNLYIFSTAQTQSLKKQQRKLLVNVILSSNTTRDKKAKGRVRNGSISNGKVEVVKKRVPSAFCPFDFVWCFFLLRSSFFSFFFFFVINMNL